MKVSTQVGLIMSGAFVGQELTAEFGALPPSFLPLGVGRLYDMQIDNLRNVFGEEFPIYLTLPDSFNIPEYDSQQLSKKNITIIPVPGDMALGDAVVFAINMMDIYGGSVHILHGDTVLVDIPAYCDVIAVCQEGDDYSWAAVHHEGGDIRRIETLEAIREPSEECPVACGYFAFSNSAAFVRALVRARGDFVGGLNNYLAYCPLKVEYVRDWYDFGHIQTYFRSRRMVTTARAFNSLKITKNTVCKLSSDHFKMQAEAEWLEGVPPAVQPYVARFLEKGEQEGQTFYSTEYQYAPNLSELYVFSSIGQASWGKILTSCKEFIELCAGASVEKPRDMYTRQLMGPKTLERLERFSKETGFNIRRDLAYQGRAMPSLCGMGRSLEDMISYNEAASATLMHGDFCFSNILYNSRNSRISVIDPRGYVFSGKKEIYGDFRYDIAKYSHSVDGLYDFILAGRYDLACGGMYDFDISFAPSLHREWLQGAWADMMIAGVSTKSRDIRAMVISLFLSMLPLHSDRPDRQKAFIANALRLYAALEGGI